MDMTIFAMNKYPVGSNTTLLFNSLLNKAKSRQTQKFFLTYIYYCAIFGWLCLCLTAYSLGKPLPGNRMMFRVSTGSMRPTFATHTIILIKKQTEYFPNQIITYLQGESQYQNDLESPLITHRIMEKRQFSSLEWYYLTQGDANEHADGWIAQSQVLGTVQVQLPAWLGWLTWQMTQNRWGRIFLLWTPLTVFVSRELLTIKQAFSEKKR